MPQTSVNRAVGMGTLTGSVSFIWSHVIWPWAIPIAAPAVTALLGWAQGLPLMFIWVGALLAFAAATTGMLRLDEWRARRRVEHKLAFSQCRFSKSIHGGAYSLGVNVNNVADFPIEFEVVELRTQIAQRVPPSQPPKVRGVIIRPGGFGWWDDGAIAVDAPAPGTLTGQTEFRLRYGHPGDLRYELTGSHLV